MATMLGRRGLRFAFPLARNAMVSSRLVEPALLFRPTGAPVTTDFPRRCFSSEVKDATSKKKRVTTHELVTDDPFNNVPLGVAQKVGRNLHLMPAHPLNTIKTKIEQHFAAHATKIGMATQFAAYDSLPPVVSTKHNFDDLLFPDSHVGRSLSDTYYVDRGHVLRTHTSAHQSTLIGRGEQAFLCSGDVYRRDEIDASHYPVFHQMEGVRIFTDDEIDPSLPREDKVAIVSADLKAALEGLVHTVFGEGTEMRWVDTYFPFTEPSYELEIFFQGEWLEVLGCGVVEQEIIRRATADADSSSSKGEAVGWAFGLGLERLAMVLFDIRDIRLFWSQDPRFMDQFLKKPGEIVQFQSYSKYPPCYKDVSFWLNEEREAAAAAAAGGEDAEAGGKDSLPFHPNDVFEIVREVAGDLVEQVSLIDDFTHPKTGRRSLCFRINYRSMDRSLTNAEVDAMQFEFRDLLVNKAGVELR